jgi:hypothetical protein
VTAAIRLEARATITGRVLDANGVPVPRATVRIPSVGGYTFVFANDSGVYRFPDMPLGDYLIQAPGPSRESLIGFMEANGYDPASAFTAGDIPRASVNRRRHRSATGTRSLPPIRRPFARSLNVDESLLVGLPMANSAASAGRSRLFQDSTTAAADIRFSRVRVVSLKTPMAVPSARSRASRASRCRGPARRRSPSSAARRPTRPPAHSLSAAFPLRSRDIPDGGFAAATSPSTRLIPSAVDRDVPRTTEYDDAESG